MKKHVVILLLCLLPAATSAQSISLGNPVQCNVGKNCFIQNYVDQDTTASYRDYSCGSLSYDKHTGTDFRLPNLAAMRQGVAVIAAADGTVRGVRDTMPDVSIRATGAPSVKNRECGNGVVIDHPAGFETQYCHLRNGSITVKQGDKVRAGQKLGLIGLSGATEFPHVHFEVRRLGRVLDPFTGQGAGTACGSAGQALWNQSAATAFRYQSTAILGAGFNAGPLEASQARTLAAPVTTIARTSPAIVLWADIMGTRKGDTLVMTILAPNGTPLAERTVPFIKHQAQFFSFMGDKATPEGLIPGEYTGIIELKRPNQSEAMLRHEAKVTVPE